MGVKVSIAKKAHKVSTESLAFRCRGWEKYISIKIIKSIKPDIHICVGEGVGEGSKFLL